VWYFSDTLAVEQLFLSDGILDRENYLNTWKSLPDANESTKMFAAVSVASVDNWVARLKTKHVFFMAQRQLQGTNQTVIYLSLKLPPATIVLVEVTTTVGTPGLKCCIKTSAPDVSPLVFEALETIMA